MLAYVYAYVYKYYSQSFAHDYESVCDASCDISLFQMKIRSRVKRKGLKQCRADATGAQFGVRSRHPLFVGGSQWDCNFFRRD